MNVRHRRPLLLRNPDFVPVVARVPARRTSRTVLRGATLTATVVSVASAVWAALGTLPLPAVYPAVPALAVCQAFLGPCIPTSITRLVADEDIEGATAVSLATLALPRTAPVEVENTV